MASRQQDHWLFTKTVKWPTYTPGLSVESCQHYHWPLSFAISPLSDAIMMLQMGIKLFAEKRLFFFCRKSPPYLMWCHLKNKTDRWPNVIPLMEMRLVVLWQTFWQLSWMEDWLMTPKVIPITVTNVLDW